MDQTSTTEAGAAPFAWLVRKRPLLETVLCCAGLVAFAIYVETLWPIFWIGCTAPLFLLQSGESRALAARVFDTVAKRSYIPLKETSEATAQAARRHADALEAGGESRGGGLVFGVFQSALLSVWALLLVPILLAFSLIVRYGSTLIYLCPGIKSIPENWRQCAFETSLLDDAWVIPGAFKGADVFKAAGLTDEFGEPTMVRGLLNVGGTLVYFVVVWGAYQIPILEGSVVRVVLGFGCIAVVPFLVAGVLALSVNLFPCFLRAALKASSIVWSPLIFYLDKPLKIGNNSDELVRHYKSSSIARFFAVKYAYLVMLAAIGAMAWDYAQFLVKSRLHQPTDTLIYVWSCLGVVNGVITIFLWEIVIPKMEYSPVARSRERWSRVVVPAKLIQGSVAMLMIPTHLLWLWPQLPDVYAHIHAFVFTVRVKFF
jgi:hypothetical protein